MPRSNQRHPRQPHASQERKRLMRRTSIKTGWLGLLAAAVVCTSGGAARAQTLLRYKFKEGEKLNYTLGQKMTMQMKIKGNDVEMKADQTIDVSWKVLAVSADGT